MKKKVYSLWLQWQIFLSYIFRIFPINEKIIIFSNYSGKGFGDNSKYIALKLHKLDPALKMYWIVKGDEEYLPQWIKPVKINSTFSTFIYARAKIWIDNSRKPLHIRKRKKQYYIQTWHGGLGIKRVENDTITPLPESWIKASKHDSAMIDFMISNSAFCTSMYKRAFWYNGCILEYGSPRNDILICPDNQLILSIKEKLLIEEETFVVLYAPTFRADREDVYDLNPKQICSLFEKRENRKTVFLVRMHPLVNPDLCSICKRKDVIDVTGYSDMYELMLISDVLITDYSSSMFEMALSGKEVQLYAKDYSAFSADRGSYFELKDIPFSIGVTEEDLYNNIMSFSKENYSPKVKAFFEKVGCCERGVATEKVANLVFDLIHK